MKTTRVSSSLTLILKIFFPLFWIVFFTCFTAGTLLSNDANLPLLNMPVFKIGTLLFLLGGILFFWLTTFKLVRVEMDEEQFYASNYYKTYKYPYQDIKKVRQNNWLLFKTVSLYLNKKGSLGKRITFLESSKRFQHFLEEHPQLFQHAVDSNE